MKNKLAFVFFISLYCCFPSISQEKPLKEAKETIKKEENNEKTYYQQYGLRLGADITKPIRSFLDKNYQVKLWPSQHSLSGANQADLFESSLV